MCSYQLWLKKSVLDDAVGCPGQMLPEVVLQSKAGHFEPLHAGQKKLYRNLDSRLKEKDSFYDQVSGWLTRNYTSFSKSIYLSSIRYILTLNSTQDFIRLLCRLCHDVSDGFVKHAAEQTGVHP